MNHEKKALKDHTDEELFKFLENNETVDLVALSGICSEILRRLIKLKNGKFNVLGK